MYFDDFTKKIGNIKASKDKAIKKHADELTKANTELAELKAAQDKAADAGNDAEYTALIGKIAVLEAKIKRLEGATAIVAEPAAVKELTEELNKAYAVEMTKQVKVIEECAAKILEAGANMAAIADEFSDMAYTASVSIDANRQAFTNESSEITHFNQLITKVIDPYTEGINTHSIRGYAMAFRY